MCIGYAFLHIIRYLIIPLADPFVYRTAVVLFTWGIWTRSFQGSIRIISSDVCPNTTLLLAKTNLTFAVCYCNVCMWTHITIIH